MPVEVGCKQGRVKRRQNAFAFPQHSDLSDVEGRSDGNGGVHGVSAAFEDVQSDLRRQRLRRRHHAVTTQNR